MVSIDREDDSAGDVWSVQLRDDKGDGGDVELYIDADSGEIVKQERDD